MQVIMPKLGLTMTEGTVVEWLKQPGQTVGAEESLCVYETEKVTLELPSPVAGVMGEILAAPGTTVPAGAAVCTVVAVGEAHPEVAERAATLEPVMATPKARSLAAKRGIDLASVKGRGPGGRIHAADVPDPVGPVRATPLARRIAAEAGIDLRSIHGSGPDGTITREDVEAARGQRPHPSTPLRSAQDATVGATGAAQDAVVGAALTSGTAATPAGKHPERSPEGTKSKDAGLAETVVPFTALRRTIAERMTQSAFTAPHVTLTTEAEATNLVSARKQLNEELPEAERISYNSLLAALVAVALREHPGLNARSGDDGIHLVRQINIALAVDTERGLMTPVLRDVDRLSLPAIQEGYAGLTGRALAGKSLPDDFAGGTFTITNLGGLEIDAFTPIINPPQAAILGVGRIVERVVPRDGQAVIRPMMALSLSFDHRIVDGAPAARFLQRVKQLVERPLALLLRR